MPSQFSYRLYDQPAPPDDVTAQLLDGLQQKQKCISPKFFYDERGSELFAEITQTEEYYLTRTEISLLKRYCKEIAELIGDECLLIEYGSGSSEKIRILLEGIKPRIYAPLDISREYLDVAANTIARDYPWLEVRATCLDYSLDYKLPFELINNTAGFFPGSSIGNFEPASALEFLVSVRQQLGQRGGFLVGVDLKKDHEILNRAYNDEMGITAKFNLNILTHLNQKYGANFDRDLFEHQAGYNAEAGCIQMFLRSKKEQEVTVANQQFHFTHGETIHTENSYKYSKQQFLNMAQAAGFDRHQFWTDAQNWFGIFYLY